jgi:hypothetical protein
MLRFLPIVLAAAISMPAAMASVTNKADNGFTVSYKANLKTSPAKAYAAFIAIGSWWGSDHTFSGDAKNLTIEARQGGCWCETLPGGGFVRHLDVVQARPNQSLVFSGGLGPLSFMAVSGPMIVTFTKLKSETEVSLTYTVGGYDPDRFAKMSLAVDQVLSAQFQNYAAFAVK